MSASVAAFTFTFLSLPRRVRLSLPIVNRDRTGVDDITSYDVIFNIVTVLTWRHWTRSVFSQLTSCCRQRRASRLTSSTVPGEVFSGLVSPVWHHVAPAGVSMATWSARCLWPRGITYRLARRKNCGRRWSDTGKKCSTGSGNESTVCC